MQLGARHPAWPLVAALLVGTGCQTAGFRLLSLMGLEQRPLSIALVADRPDDAVQAVNPFAAYRPLQTALAEQLGRPVALDVCFCFQVEPCLANGWYDLAVVTATQYARLKNPAAVRTLCVAADRKGRTARSAVLVVRSGSEIETVQDLRGRVVGFGPAEDAIVHHGAVQYLQSQGVRLEDLALDMLPIPGSPRHYPDGRATAEAVLSGAAAAGFIDEADWDELPEVGNGPARDQLRVIGRTPPLPLGLLIASPRLDSETAQRVREFALQVGMTRPEVLAALPVSGYREPEAALIDACLALQLPAQSRPGMLGGNQSHLASDEQASPPAP